MLLLDKEISLVNATVPPASGKVIVRSAVGSVTDTVVSKSLAVEPSKTILPLAIEIALAASATPETRVVEDREVKPAIVEPVAPKAIACTSNCLYHHLLIEN